MERLFEDQELCNNANARAGLNDMVLLFKYLEVFEVLDKVFVIGTIFIVDFFYYSNVY